MNTKADLLAHMREAHSDFYAMLDRIPDERTSEIALYDNWTIKDLIAHLGWWYQSAADRIAAARRGDAPQTFSDYDALNAEVQAQYRDTPLAEVRAMEAKGFALLEDIVENADEAELFDAARYPKAARSVASYIIGNTYGHYEDHLPDAKAWMTQHNLA